MRSPSSWGFTAPFVFEKVGGGGAFKGDQQSPLAFKARERWSTLLCPNAHPKSLQRGCHEFPKTFVLETLTKCTSWCVEALPTPSQVNWNGNFQEMMQMKYTHKGSLATYWEKEGSPKKTTCIITNQNKHLSIMSSTVGAFFSFSQGISSVNWG